MFIENDSGTICEIRKFNFGKYVTMFHMLKMYELEQCQNFARNQSNIFEDK